MIAPDTLHKDSETVNNASVSNMFPKIGHIPMPFQYLSSFPS